MDWWKVGMTATTRVAYSVGLMADWTVGYSEYMLAVLWGTMWDVMSAAWKAVL